MNFDTLHDKRNFIENILTIMRGCTGEQQFKLLEQHLNDAREAPVRKL